ncbi:MAG: DNA polymerase III subunit beta [Actinobacteria bacterium]|nr:DNA polymerase III subunit beta [Actinomycetota bacterium]
MQFRASQSDLSLGLQTAAKAVSSKNTLPILSGILLKADRSRLNLTATDLELGIECQVPATVEVPGAIVLPAKYFAEIVRRIPSGDIRVSVDPQNFTATIRWERSQYIIHGFSPDQFPFLPQPQEEPVYSVRQEVLRDLIRQTAFAVSHDEARPVLTGVCLTLTGKQVEMVATDGVRIAYRRGDLAGKAEATDSVRLVIPGRAVNELARLLSGNEDDLASVHLTENQVFFDLGELRLVSRLLDGQYPEVLRLIPQDYPTRVRLSIQEFHDACERAALIVRDGSNTIKLGITPEQMTITSSMPEVGQVYEELTAAVEGEGLEIGLNPKFLSDCLRVLDSEEFVFEFTGPKTPSRIKLADSDDFLYLVLPVVLW